MYLDNLSIAGIVVVSFYGLLPLLFGREFLRVEEEDQETHRLVYAEGVDKAHCPPNVRCGAKPEYSDS